MWQIAEKCISQAHFLLKTKANFKRPSCSACLVWLLSGEDIYFCRNLKNNFTFFEISADIIVLAIGFVRFRWFKNDSNLLRLRFGQFRLF